MPDDWLDGATSAVEEGASANVGTAPAGATSSAVGDAVGEGPMDDAAVEHGDAGSPASESPPWRIGGMRIERAEGATGVRRLRESSWRSSASPASPNKLQLPCQCCLVDNLGGFAVGTQMRGISLFPLVSLIETVGGGSKA